MKSISAGFTLLLLLFSQNLLAEFGPWPHPYFLDDGLLSCAEEGKCRGVSIGDVEALKKDWESFEEIRLKHLEELKEGSRALIDQAFNLAQGELEKNSQSVYGETLMELTTLSNEKIQELTNEEIHLWVSNSSPIYELFNELEKLINTTESGESLSVEEYKSWWLQSKNQDLFQRIKAIQAKYFPSEKGLKKQVLIHRLLELKTDAIQSVSFQKCPKALVDLIRKTVGELYLFTPPVSGSISLVDHQEKAKAILPSSKFQSPIMVRCDTPSLLGKIEFKRRGDRSFEVIYAKINSNNTYRFPNLDPIYNLFKVTSP